MPRPTCPPIRRLRPEELRTPSSALTSDSPLLERMRAAAALLEAVEHDRGLLARVPEEDRQRLLRATRQVSHPDPRARRRLVKATTRERRAQQVKQGRDSLPRRGHP